MSSTNLHGVFLFGEFRLDTARRSFLREGRAVVLSPTTFDLLVYLVANAQRVVTKEELIRAIWPRTHVEESSLSQHVFLLRKALTASRPGDRLILSVPGVGYQFTDPVVEVTGHNSESSGQRVKLRAAETHARASFIDNAAPECESDLDADPIPAYLRVPAARPIPLAPAADPTPLEHVTSPVTPRIPAKVEPTFSTSPLPGSFAPLSVKADSPQAGTSRQPVRTPDPDSVPPRPINLGPAPLFSDLGEDEEIAEAETIFARAKARLKTPPQKALDSISFEPIQPPANPKEPSLKPAPVESHRQQPTFEDARNAAVHEESAQAGSHPEPQPHTNADDFDPRPARRAAFLGAGPMRISAATLGILVLATAGWLSWRYLHRPHPASLRLAVADFQNSTGDFSFDPALTTALALDLGQSPMLSVAAAPNPASNSGARESQPAQDITPAAARDLCQLLNSQAYLTGSIQRFGRKFLLNLQARQCPTGAGASLAHGQNLAASKGLADSPDAVLSLLDKMALDIRSQLGESPTTRVRFSKPLFGGRAPSLAALQSYADAVYLRSQGKFPAAVPLLERAIQIDPQFVLAHADLADTYQALGLSDAANASLSRASLARAYDLRDTAGEPTRLRITAAYHSEVSGDLNAAIHDYESWASEYPSNAAALSSLAALQLQTGKPVPALDHARKALELDPGNAPAYATLANAEMHLGQFDEAEKTCRQALGRHVANEPEIRILLYQLAFRQLDQPAMDEQIAWADDPSNSEAKAAEPDFEMEQIRMNLAIGKVRTAQTLLVALVDNLRRANEPVRAASLESGVPRVTAELGLPETARGILGRIPADSVTSLPGAADLPFAWALLGETTRASNMLQTQLDAHPASTLWVDQRAPWIRAAIALNNPVQHRHVAAIEALRPAQPYDLASFDYPFLRAQAYLAANQPELAEAEYHKILDHPGIDPLSELIPLAQLGLARSLARQGKSSEAGFAYRIVFQIWQDADSDLPGLKHARDEFAHLGNTSHAAMAPPAGQAKPPASRPAAGVRR